MQARMLCTDCGVTAHADTLIEGSDRVEAAAWVLGAAFGWLYCARRHWLRTKVCTRCGGGALVRESRAAAALMRPIPAETRVIACGARVDWPRSLRSPRQRLHAGAPAAALAILFAGAAAGTAALGIPLQFFAAIGLVWTACALLWTGLALLRYRLELPWDAGCRAWDAHGRSLRIEIL